MGFPNFTVLRPQNLVCQIRAPDIPRFRDFVEIAFVLTYRPQAAQNAATGMSDFLNDVQAMPASWWCAANGLAPREDASVPSFHDATVIMGRLSGDG